MGLYLATREGVEKVGLVKSAGAVMRFGVECKNSRLGWAYVRSRTMTPLLQNFQHTWLDICLECGGRPLVTANNHLAQGVPPPNTNRGAPAARFQLSDRHLGAQQLCLDLQMWHRCELHANLRGTSFMSDVHYDGTRRFYRL